MALIFILSFIQGVAEFLPISSSSHLIIISKYYNFSHQGLLLDVSLHIGSFLAVISYFYRDLINFFQNRELFFKIFIASVPVMIVGFFLVKTNLIVYLRNIEIIGWTTLIFGIFLYISDRFKLENNVKDYLNFKSVILIGFFQVLSLIPGVSRSGITISAARILKFKRYDAAKISFLLSIPTLGAVSVYGLGNIIVTKDVDFSALNLTAIFLSFFFSFLTIKYFLHFLKKFSLKIFVIYRLILGTILLLISYL